jgi:Zn-dependent protease
VPRDPYLPGSGMTRVLRALGLSVPVGRIGGVAVRVYVFGFLLVALLFGIELAHVGYGLGEVLVLGFLFTFLLDLVTLTHELGHVAAGRRFRVPASLVTISPLGGLAHLDAPTPSPRAEILVALAGPAVHLPWIALAWVGTRWVGPDVLRPSAWVAGPAWQALRFLLTVNLALLFFNLLPVYPLDGGRVLRAWLARRMHPNRATLIAARVGMVGAGCFLVAAFFQPRVWSGILVAIALTVFLACLRARREARWGEGPYGPRREAWESDPEAWKHRLAGPSGAQRRRAARDVRAREASVRLAADVDRILDRVHEVGMAGLTRRERRTLRRASKEQRRE